jgi:hypothetical protein
VAVAAPFSLQGDFTFDNDPLVTVTGRLEAVLIVPEISGQQASYPETARGHRANAIDAAALGWFDELHGLPNMKFVGLHYG